MCTTPNYQISIPKPCHEDWNKMTPDEKGAFCGSCQKSVYDFSNKSVHEIDTIIKDNPGKSICGRFKSTQLEPVEKVPLYMLPSKKPSLRVFAYALLLVFGSTLFSCNNDDDTMVGKLVSTQQPISNDTTGLIEDQHVVGRVVNGGDTATIKAPVIEDDHRYMMVGEIDYVPNDTAVTPSLQLKDSIIDIEPQYVNGGLAIQYIHGITVPVNNIEDSVAQDVILNNTVVENPGKLKMDVYPNPARDEVTLGYSLVRKNNVRIELFDLSGNRIKSFVNSASHYEGSYKSTFNVSELAAGTYLCTFTSGENSISKKIVVIK